MIIVRRAAIIYPSPTTPATWHVTQGGCIMKKLACGIIASSILLSGCETSQMRAILVSDDGVHGEVESLFSSFHRRDATKTDQDPTSHPFKAALITWLPDQNSAYLSNDGRGCIRAAAAMKSKNVSASGDASLSGPAIGAPANIGGHVDKTEIITPLVENDVGVDFLDVGLFYLCLKDINDKMNASSDAKNGQNNNSEKSEKLSKDDYITIFGNIVDNASKVSIARSQKNAVNASVENKSSNETKLQSVGSQTPPQNAAPPDATTIQTAQGTGVGKH